MKSENQQMSDGTFTKSLFIKHLSTSDWELIKMIKLNFNVKSNADVIRFALKRTAGLG